MRSFLTTLGSLIAATPLLASAPSFTGPEVLKLDWSTRALSVSDIDGDGLNDLALINQDTAQIELLYQLSGDDSSRADKKRISRSRWDPVLEDARFDNDGVAVGFPVFDLAVGDLNGDGLRDMAYTSREVPLTIRYQTENGQWSDLTEFDNFAALGWTGTIKIQDLNADGRAEVIVVASDAVRIFKHDSSCKLQEPDLFYLTGENPYNLLLEDLDADGLTDILYITASGKQSLVMREQLEDGGFGPERRFIFERPVRIVQPMPGTEGAPLQFCSVDSRSGSLDFFELHYADGENDKDAAILQPHVYPIFQKGRDPASYSMGDFDGDGDQDLLVANPREAEVALFLKDETGFEAPRHFPSFSSISSMASGHFYSDAPAHVVMVSAEEKTIGRSMIGSAERLIFPKTLSIGDADPVACEVLDLDRDGLDELVLITDQKGKYSLSILVPVDRGVVGSDFEIVHEVKLAGVKRKPTALLPLDIFGDDRSGLMVFVPREAPLLLATEAASFETLTEVGADSAIRQNLLKDIHPSQVSVFDVNGDGLSEMVVGRKGYARALKVVNGELEMVDQFNARQGEDEIAVVLPLYSDGVVNQMILYVASSGELQRLRRSDDGVFRYEVSEKVGQIDVLGWSALGASDQFQDYVFYGDAQFWYMPFAGDSWSKRVIGSYETELEDVHYTHIESADFDEDGSIEIVAVDGQKHVVEILSKGANTWESLMYWEIFEQNMHYQGRQGGKLEPRQTIIADLTGDGALDFAFLIHDRVLFYPQNE